MSIRQRTRACKSLFEACVAGKYFYDLFSLRSRKREFTEWATRLDADSIGSTSLDYRMRNDREQRYIVLGLLGHLKSSLEFILQALEDGTEDSEPDNSDYESDYSIASSDIERPDTPFYMNIIQVKNIIRGLERMPDLERFLTRLAAFISKSSNEPGPSTSTTQVPNSPRFTDIQRRLIHANIIKIGQTPTPTAAYILAHLKRSNKARRNWSYRKHVSQDIVPHVCIYDDCRTPNTIYGTPNELLHHMRQEHAVTYYICYSCQQAHEQFVFGSVHAFEAHMNQRHGLGLLSSIPPSVLSLGRRQMLPTLSCPLCSYESKPFATALDEHIENHLHEFSIRCLPWNSSDNTAPVVAGSSGTQNPDSSSGQNVH